jgi:hypothetical protein
MTKTYVKRTPIEKLAIVNSRFRSGDLQKVVTKTGFKTPVVTKTINGNVINEKVLNYAFDMVRNRKPNLELLADFFDKKS